MFVHCTYLFEQTIGNTIQVFSDRQQKLCHRCLERGHLTAFCCKPIKSRTDASKCKTWAMVASVAKSEPVKPVDSNMSDETSVELMGNHSGFLEQEKS